LKKLGWPEILKFGCFEKRTHLESFAVRALARPHARPPAWSPGRLPALPNFMLTSTKTKQTLLQEKNIKKDV
jgi:hypothetical protein